MRKFRNFAGAALSVMLCTSHGLEAKPLDAAPKVIELFTSQSCSSCPPADEVLRELADMPNVIALSCNVTYWNHLSWTDTLSKPFCTARQQSYSNANNRNGIYTPELVINGQGSFVGSRKREVLKAVEKAAPLKVVTILPAKQHGVYTVSLPEVSGADLSVIGISFRDFVVTYIQRGENRGETLRHTHPVTDITTLKDTWDGHATTFDVMPRLNPKGGYVVIVQEGPKGSGTMVAAGQL